MSVYKLIHFFSSCPVVFEFQSSTPPDNITLNAASMKADQGLSEFQTGIAVAAYATLNMEQLIFTPELHLLISFPHYKIVREE